MKGLSAKWQKLLVWLTGYLSIIAFVLVGGYFWKNTEEKGVKSSAKYALLVVAVFTAFDIFITIFRYAFYMGEASLPAFFTNLNYLMTILKAVGFVVLFILDVVGVLPAWGEKAKSEEQTEEKDEVAE